MSLNKSARNKIIWGSISFIILAVIILAGLIFIAQPKVDGVRTFYDKELGLVTVKEVTCNGLCNLFSSSTKQLFYPDKTIYHVGDTATGSSYIVCVGGSGTVSADVDLFVKQPPTYSLANIYSKSTTLSAGYGKYLYWSFPVTKTGTYHVYDCITCSNMASQICSNDYYTKNIDVQAQITTCPADAFLQWDVYQWGSDIGKPGLEQYRCERYSKYTLSGSSCTYSTYCKSYQTVCNSGYVVSGTDSQIGDGKQDCVQKVVTPVPECNADLTSTCPSGSTITTKLCVNGFWQDTGAVCPECSTDQTQTCSDGSSIVLKRCVNGAYQATTNQCPTQECTQDLTQTCSDGSSITTKTCQNYHYQDTGAVCPGSNQTSGENNTNNQTNTACPAIATQCPDGTYVGMILKNGNCVYADCPTNQTNNNQTSGNNQNNLPTFDWSVVIIIVVIIVFVVIVAVLFARYYPKKKGR